MWEAISNFFALLYKISMASHKMEDKTKKTSKLQS
jgi:hypothetical protein